jgi:hypothetical protein
MDLWTPKATLVVAPRRRFRGPGPAGAAVTGSARVTLKDPLSSPLLFGAGVPDLTFSDDARAATSSAGAHASSLAWNALSTARASSFWSVFLAGRRR